MKVVVNDEVFELGKDGVNKIMVIMDKDDKDFISNMSPDNMNYCVFDDHLTQREVENWMSCHSSL